VKVYAFDFWNTLTNHGELRDLARQYYKDGHEVHIVSAISPGLPMDSDHYYELMLQAIKVPFTAIHRVDHKAELKIEVLHSIQADEFWDDTEEYVQAARNAGFLSHLVGDP